MDQLSKLLSQGLDILLVKNPVRTSLGIVLGCTLEFFNRVFEPALRSLPGVDFAARPWWGWVVVGTLVMHFPTIIMLFRQRPMGDEELDKALMLIERGNFTEAERRQQFRQLIKSATTNIGLSQKTQREVEKLERSIKRSEPSSPDDSGFPPASIT